MFRIRVARACGVGVPVRRGAARGGADMTYVQML
jgi:hypothetical protein